MAFAFSFRPKLFPWCLRKCEKPPDAAALQLVPAVVALVAHFSPAFIGQALAQVPPLPAPEVFVANEDLVASLRLKNHIIRVGEHLPLTLRFENRGTRPLYIVPRHPTPMFALQTKLAASPEGAINHGRRVIIQIKREQLVALAPGQQWNMPLDSLALRSPLSLAPGDYTASVTYVNYPDYDYAHYDPYTMPTGIWEGMLTTLPIRFTVKPPARAELARWIEQLRAGAEDELTVRLLSVSGVEGVRALHQHFADAPYSQTGLRILIALGRVGPLPLTELIDAIKRLPDNLRQSLVGSPEFSFAVGDRVSCELLDFLVSQLDVFPGPGPRAFHHWFSAGAARCPRVREQLRQVVISPTRPPYARHNAAALLGAFQHADDLRLLRDIVERRAAIVPAPSAVFGDLVREGAVVGLGTFGGPEALETLTRALTDEPRNQWIAPTVVDVLFRSGNPKVIPALIGALSFSNSSLVISAISGVGALEARTGVPHLVPLLRHSNPQVRSYAASTIRLLGDERVRKPMLAAMNDLDEHVQAAALFYLAEHGDSSLRDRFIQALQSPKQPMREAAVKGIGRFGTELDFPKLRRLFELFRPQVLGYLPSALGALTFASHSYPSERLPGYWDEWYASHRGTTRVEWARRALRRTDRERAQSRSFDPGPQRLALEFLSARRDRQFLPDFRRAAVTTRYAVRVEAARAISAFDRRTAALLLIREFGSRFQGACVSADEALNRLTGLARRTNCHDPRARMDAAVVWQSAANAL